MKVAVVAFDGFSEIDTFLVLGLLGELRADGWSAQLAAPAARLTSVNGVQVEAQQSLEYANEADAVVFAGGLFNRAVAEESAWLDRLQPDPVRQSFGGLCAGSLLMARLGLLGTTPACADAATRPYLVEAGVLVLDDQPFHARGPVATAGGLLAAPCLAAWLVARQAGEAAAVRVLRAAAPVGDRLDWVGQVMGTVRPFLATAG